MSENLISNIKIDDKTYAINDPTKASIESVNGLLSTTVENNTLLSSANFKLDELLEKIENNNGETQSTSFYKCITSNGGEVIGIRVDGTTEGAPEGYFDNYDGDYILKDPETTGSSREFVAEGIGKIIYSDFAMDLYCWGLLGDNDSGWTDTFISYNTDENATIEEICSSPGWSHSRYYENGESWTITSLKDASSLSWSGNKMIWNENEWQETDELGENLPISGYTPEAGRIYSEDTTIDATLYPMENLLVVEDVKPGAANVLLVIYKPNEGATRYNTVYNPTDINAVGTTRTWKPISNEQILRWNNGNWEIVDVLDPTLPGEIIGNVSDPWNVEANMFNGYAIKAISLE